jgi:hypothetical protein
VNDAAVATQTDAVGDANVFTTFDPGWFVDLRATNANGVDGPAQAYANLGQGLVIYSGLDKDFLPGGSFDPTATDGASHLNRIRLLELLQPWDPDNLPHANPVIGGRYVALGDSYSSGEGAIDSSGVANFESGTDVSGNKCHRSEDAYSHLLKADRSVNDDDFIFRACSGALMAHFVAKVGQSGQWNEGPQLDAIAPADKPSLDTSLVTLSVGGNDAAFPQVLDACVTGFFHKRQEKKCLAFAESSLAKGVKLIANGGYIVVKPKDGTWFFCEKGCIKWAPKLSPEAGVAVNVPSLSRLYQRIHDRAPNAKLRVLLYPHLFGPNPPNTCVVGTFPSLNQHDYTVSKTVMTKINGLGDRLNQAIADQVTLAKQKGIDIEAVSPVTEFDGHEICGTKVPWINGLILKGPVLVPSALSPFSFHPNAMGQNHFEIVLKSHV